MKDIWNWIQLAIAAGGGAIGWFFGGLDSFLYALIAFVAVDYITGVLRAVVEKQLSSRIGAHGIAKKVALFLLVGIAHVADTHLLGNTGALRTAVICFYLSNEGVSLLENAAAIGLPVPAKLKDVLAQLHEKTGAKPANPSEEERGEVVVPPHPGAETPTQNEQADIPPQNTKEGSDHESA